MASNVTTYLSDRTTNETFVRSSRRWIVQHWEKLWIALILLAAALAHGTNMYGFPYYFDDEGTYMAQAWAVVNLGELSHYTYWYDHAPLGWIQITVWTLVTGGFYEFGTAIDSGRMLMLIMQVASTFMVYRIARNVSGSVVAASVAALAFALSAWGIYNHRRVMLDNIATFWALLSIIPLVGGRLNLRRVWFSAVALGISVLSKELTVFLFPVVVTLVFCRVDRLLRWFAIIGWIALIGCVVSTYVLMATLKTELFPTGTFLGGTHEHVSLIETLRYQMSRGAHDGGVLNPNSDFWEIVTEWAGAEPLLVVVGSISALISIVLIKWQRLVGIMGLATLSLWAFVARGGEVLGFYLVPLLPFLALNIGLVLGTVISFVRARLQRHAVIKVLVAALVQLSVSAVCVALLVQGHLSSFYSSGQASPDTMWENNQTLAQVQAVNWVKRNIARDSYIVLDDSMWLDLRDVPNSTDDFKGVLYYWKLDRDPEIGKYLLNNNWRKVDYVVKTPSVEGDAYGSKLGMVQSLLENSTPIASFDTGGWPVTVQRVNKLQQRPAPSDPVLAAAWEDYKRRFIEDGRVVDLGADRRTTSEGQSYALLRAVYMNDRRTFDELWHWTNNNLRTRNDSLLAWHWGRRADGTMGVIDQSSATDADQDTALALLFAARRWNDPEYKERALEIIGEIWDRETAEIRNQRVVVAGDWARGDGTQESKAIVNPSYFAPYAYKIFAEVDTEHPWEELVNSSYSTLERIQSSTELGGQVGLMPNWLAIEPTTGELDKASNLGVTSSQFSYDASRVPWRIALDYLWFKDNRARETLKRFDFPRHELERTDRLFASYSLEGRPTSNHEATSMYAGIILGLLVSGDRATAHRVFAEKIFSAYQNGPKGAYWGKEPNNYYDQNMAWFATAIMDGAMSNLWEGEQVINWGKALKEDAASKSAEG